MDIHHGIFIDVFALDHYPATPGARRRMQFRSKLISSSIARKCGWNREENIIKKLLKLPLDLLYPTMYKAVSAQEKLYKSVPHSGLLVNYCGAWGEREIMPEEWFGEPETLEFDGVTVCVPKEYDKCLSQLYGDYMQLPPEEKRVTHHLTEVIDLERSYKEYRKEEKL
jgi:lipopolysaccharide cholinephosphotransferase